MTCGASDKYGKESRTTISLVSGNV